MDVAPSHKEEGVLSMVNQWFECFITDEIEWVL